MFLYCFIAALSHGAFLSLNSQTKCNACCTSFGPPLCLSDRLIIPSEKKRRPERKIPSGLRIMRSGSASGCLHHAAHTAHARFFLFFGQICHGHLGGEHQPRDTRCILYGASRDFGRVDDAGFPSTGCIDGSLCLFQTAPFIAVPDLAGLRLLDSASNMVYIGLL